MGLLPGGVTLRQRSFPRQRPGSPWRLPMRVRPLLAATMCLAAARLAAAPGELASTVEQFEHLAVGAESVAVSNLRLKSDHLDCLFVSGRAAPVRAGEDVV